MRDDVTFEARLADALGRYAELAPAMDDAAVAKRAILAGAARRTGRLWRRGMLDLPGTRAAWILIVLGLVLAAILAAITAGLFHSDPFGPLARNGAIAFTVQPNDHGPAGSYVMSADGAGAHGIGADRCPTYARDGALLTSLTYEGSANLVMRDPGGHVVHDVALVETPSTTVSWALSPDGTTVAWVNPIAASAASGSSVELWVRPIAGGPGTRILPASTVPGESYDSPVWSPDGKRLAVGTFAADASSGERRRTAIIVVAADGSDLRRLTTRPALMGDGMSWSPDGRSLAYLGLPDSEPLASGGIATLPLVDPPRDIFLITTDGTDERNLTNSPDFESQPEWAPDGLSLAFGTSVDGKAPHLTTVRMNGPTLAGPLVRGPESDWFVWSPDASSLLWLQVESLGAESVRSTLHSIDRDLQGPSTTLQVVDGLIVCPPSWQQLEP